MNREQLEQRLKDIEFSISQLSQQIGWLQGGAEEVKHWLKQLDDAQKVKTPEKKEVKK